MRMIAELSGPKSTARSASGRSAAVGSAVDGVTGTRPPHGRRRQPTPLLATAIATTTSSHQMRAAHGRVAQLSAADPRSMRSESLAIPVYNS
jgi:hypothetical protein